MTEQAIFESPTRTEARQAYQDYLSKSFAFADNEAFTPLARVGAMLEAPMTPDEAVASANAMRNTSKHLDYWQEVVNLLNQIKRDEALPAAVFSNASLEDFLG